MSIQTIIVTLPVAGITELEVTSVGSSGRSAYQSYLATTSDDPPMIEAEWSAGGGGASITISTTPPASPAEGDLWQDSETGIISVYDGTVWVGTDNPAVSAAIAELLAAEDAAAARTALELGTAAVEARSYITVAGAGIDPTGAADSSEAIAALIAASQAAGGPNELYFPAGTYKCNLALTGNLRIFGAGNGDVGDWTGGVTAKTTFVPASNAAPVMSVTASNGMTFERFEIRGNGAGTSVEGLRIAAPGGYRLMDVNIRRFTKNFRSLAGCNVDFDHSGFFQGNVDVSIEDSGFAHSYVMRLCSIGGAPATGSGRCFEISGGSFITLINCEQGNCTDYLSVVSGAPKLVIIQSNWETFSADLIMDIGAASLAMTGARMAVGAKRIVRANTNAGFLAITLDGVACDGGATLLEHNGISYAHITSCPNALVKKYSADWSTLVASSGAMPIREQGRLTIARSVSAGATTVIFNTLDATAGNYNTTTGVFTATRQMKVLVSCSLRLSTVPGGYAGIRFLVNGAEVSNPALVTSGGAGTTIAGCEILDLAAGGTLAIAVTCGGALDVQVGSNYSSKFAIVELPIW